MRRVPTYVPSSPEADQRADRAPQTSCSGTTGRVTTRPPGWAAGCSRRPRRRRGGVSRTNGRYGPGAPGHHKPRRTPPPSCSPPPRTGSRWWTPRWTAVVPSFQHSPQYRHSSSARPIVPPLDAGILRRDPTDVHGPACCRPPEKLAAGAMTPAGTSARRQLRNSKSCSCGGGRSGACRSPRRLRGSEHEGVRDRLQGRRTRRGHRRTAEASTVPRPPSYRGLVDRGAGR